MKELKSLLNLMFSSEDTVCVSDSKWAYHSMPISSVTSGSVTLVSPNQKVSTKDVDISKLVLLSINPINGFRNDSNVYRHQTFLWEIDVGTLGSQMAYMRDLGLPWSACIFSGNKSIHFITVLEEPLDSKTYKMLYKWGLAIGTYFDQNCKNPSRCVRIPGVIRPDTDKYQKLIKIKAKIKNSDFIEWLNKYSDLKPKQYEPRNKLTKEDNYDKLSPWARKQLKYGMDFSKGRNKAWFSMGCDLFSSSYSEEECIEILSTYFKEESDFREKEFLTAINSAYKYMANKI